MEIDLMNKIKPIYKTFKSWDSSQLNKSSLPKSLLSMTKYIEKFLNVKIIMLSVGPERDQIIYL